MALHVPTTLPPLHAAAGRGDLEEVVSLLETGADPNALEREIGAAPLHLAAQAGSVPVAEALLEAGAFLSLQAPSHGMTALQVAVWHRRPAFVAFALGHEEAGVSIVNYLGLTAAQMIGLGSVAPDPAATLDDSIRAAFQKREDELAAAATLDSLDTLTPLRNDPDGGQTALHLAARDGDAKRVAELLAAGADQRVVDVYMKSLALHKAASFGHADVIALLTADTRFPEVADAQGPFNGYTPLHDAVWHGHLEAAQVLLEAGVRTDISGWDGRTARDLAQESGYDEVVTAIDGRG